MIGAWPATQTTKSAMRGKVPAGPRIPTAGQADQR